MDPVSKQFTTASYAQYERLHMSIDSLVDKTIDTLAEKNSVWLSDLIQHSEGYSKSLEGKCFFVPFISKNIAVLSKAIISEMKLTQEEQDLSENELFIKNLEDSIFSKTSLVNSWFSELTGE